MASRLYDAVQYALEHPEAPKTRVAAAFKVKRETLRDRVNRPTDTKQHGGNNKTFTKAEEKALCNYIDRLDRINLAVRPEFVTEAANLILLKRLRATDSEGRPIEIPTVGTKWTTRFLKRHGYFHRTQKQLQAERQSAEDVESITLYYERLRTVILENGIGPNDTWNMDGTGFRIGVGKNQLIVTKRKRAHYFGLPENRESATIIETISAGGASIPAFIILQATVHMAQWYQQSLHPETKICPVDTGYPNDEVCLEWLKHFEYQSRKSQKGRRRLLIIDGHGSHHTKQFIQFCEDHDIIPFGLPPHLTHLLQPLDVVVFQPYKHYHAKALDLLVRDGVQNISKLEFLSIIENVRKSTFKRSTIESAFRKTGIYPFNPTLVLQEVYERQAKTPTPSPPPHSSSIDNTPTTLRQIHKVAVHIENSLSDPELGLSPEFATKLNRFIKGSLINATELVQVKRDLGRTKYAERVAKQRRSMKNYQLQSGGVLSVSEGREMVKKKVESEVVKAQRILDSHNERIKKTAKKAFSEAAKKSRQWRKDGNLKPAEIVTTGGVVKQLRRF